MCPSIEGSLRELVSQVVNEENLNRSSFNQDGSESKVGFGLSTQLKLGSRLTELHEQMRHIFEGQAQFRRELEHLKLDMVSKSVSKADFEAQLLLKANKQTVANALQRKANKNEVEPRIANLEAVVLPKSGKSVHTPLDTLNECLKNLEDRMTEFDLKIDEKVAKKVNFVEDSLKKVTARDMQRVDTELLILNTNFSTLSTEQRTLEEKLRGLTPSSRLQESETLVLQVDNIVKGQLQRLGLSGSGPSSFRDSLQKLLHEGSLDNLIQTSNKEIQH